MILIIAPFLAACGFTCIIGKPFIRWLKSVQKMGQPIRLNGPQEHLANKKGTPTMGGILIFLGFAMGCLAALICAPHEKNHAPLFLLLSIFTTFGLIGCVDDALKLRAQSHTGLSGKKRLLLETTLAFVGIVLGLHFHILSSTLTIPLFHSTFELGYGYIPLAVFIIVGSANAVNLTDGLDGLATGTSLVALIALGILAIFSAQSAHIVPAISALSGALVAFFVFNRHPARLFMGDMGSLALGSALGMLSLMLKLELLWGIIGTIFVAETLSVILQVVSYRLRGRRLFLMAPLHHHFEKKGWHEVTVTRLFIFLAILCAALGIAIQFLAMGCCSGGFFNIYLEQAAKIFSGNV